MKLKNIKINNLFGLEDNNFDIDLFPKEKITLLYGFNGVGKTSLIKLIDAVLSLRLTELYYISFSNLIITFNDDSYLKVSKNSDSIHIIGHKKSCRTIAHTFSLDDLREGFFDNLTEMGINKFKRYFNINSNIIFANRDFNRVINSPSSIWDNLDKIDINSKIIDCSEQSARIIYEYLKLQFEKDNTFKQESNENHARPPYHYYAHIPDKLDELVKKIFNPNDNYFSEEKKRLFEDIINKEFGMLYKNVQLSRKDLSLKNIYTKDPIITLEMLSSGEKNIICLFLELIFLSNDNSVFFLDEPETSLHISWQSKLVNCIFKVCEKQNMQVIIATHSPDVIDDYELITTDIHSERFKDGKKFFDN